MSGGTDRATPMVSEEGSFHSKQGSSRSPTRSTPSLYPTYETGKRAMRSRSEFYEQLQELSSIRLWSICWTCCFPIRLRAERTLSDEAGGGKSDRLEHRDMLTPLDSPRDGRVGIPQGKEALYEWVYRQH